MSYVITEKCLGERYATCVSVCPVECIFPGDYQGQQFMVIDPELCITCGMCLPECPIGAIVDSDDKDPAYTAINKDLSPQFKSNPAVTPRAANDPPKKPGNKLMYGG